MSEPIRVVIADDHTLFRKGLAELLEQSARISVVGISGNGDDAFELVRTVQPDAVIIDLNMPPQGGLQFLRRLRAEGWKGAPLILTVSDDEDDLASALRGGAKGYLLKDMEPDEVVDAVCRAVAGETVVAPAMTLKMVKLLQSGGKSRADENPLKALTAREKEILQFLALGMSNKAIARELEISHDTVKLHVRHILAKLNLTSRVEAAVFVVESAAAPFLPKGRFS
jgi:two-component system, NarL family, nitrate/nitrite response regulator NarL